MTCPFRSVDSVIHCYIPAKVSNSEQPQTCILFLSCKSLTIPYAQPIESDGTERYVYYVMSHVSIDEAGNTGVVTRLGRGNEVLTRMNSGISIRYATNINCMLCLEKGLSGMRGSRWSAE